MNFQGIARQVEKVFSVTYFAHQILKFEEKGKEFAVCDNGDTFTIYRVYADGDFAPGSGSGKSIRKINSFVKARI